MNRNRHLFVPYLLSGILASLYSLNAIAADTLIHAEGVVTAGTGLLAVITPPGTRIEGPIRVDVLRGVIVGPANILSIDLNVGGFCFSTQSPSMCPMGGDDVPITSIDESDFIVDVGSDMGVLVFTAFSASFGADIIISFDLDANTLFADGGTLGTVSGTIEFAVDSDSDGDPDISDPDDDGDGIGDALDTDPAIPNNQCTAGDSDNAILGEMIISDLTCAANVSIDVQGATQVLGPDGHLRLISPFIWFQSGFSSGRLTVVSADPCPGCSYAIGETGPAGGIVFYVTDDGTHGLESAPSDQGYTGWGCSGTDLAGAEGVAIGTGAQNTLDIIAACQIEGIPAYIADNFSLNGFDDWFLPSRDELNLLYANLHIAGLGEFTWNSYWSSSEIDADLAWAQFFASGAQAAANKIINRGVRAIRAF